MVEFTPTLVDQDSRGELLESTFRIPALTESRAEKRAVRLSKLKDFANPRVESTEQIESTSIPGQKIYEVVVLSSR